MCPGDDAERTGADMIRLPLVILSLLTLLVPVASGTGWSVEPVRLYAGALRAVPVRVVSPSEERREAVLAAEFELIDPERLRVIARAPVDLDDRSIDLAETFPVLWTARSPRVLYCQLYIDNEPTGAPLVIEPLLSRPSPPTNALDDQLRRAFDASDADEINRLLALSDRERSRLRALPAPEDSSVRSLLTGLRVYPLVRVRFETTHGPIDVRLRPDAAPLTVRRFVDFVEDGYYTDVAFHRVVRADDRGRRVLVQTGDPTGTGAGAPGEHFDYEPSTMRHAYGVLSLARDPERPNTSGGQFFICLSDAAGAQFDGRYTAFAEIIEGADALEAIVRTPLGLSDPNDPSSPRDRPLEPATIRSARTYPAPALDPSGTREPRIRPEDQSPVVR
ncbi:MAG: hypothetical protein Tsb0013_17880 [Phycisphaerales bacterium]